jgi:hypothetical protein
LISRRAVLAAGLAAVALPAGTLAQQGSNSASQEPSDMKITMTFDGMTMTATLYDNPSARDFYSMLPLELTMEDYGSNEKIAHLPRKLTEKGSGAFGNERPGDLCYFMPWGNLAMFHAAYTFPGLIRLGRFDDGFEPLLVPGDFPLRIEPVRKRQISMAPSRRRA